MAEKKKPGFIPYHRSEKDAQDMIQESHSFFQLMDQRRSCRDFSDTPVPQEVIENIIKTASTAPSGAHKQPWFFVAVKDPGIKKKIRMAAEAEEKDFYEKRAPEEWLEDLAPLGTDWHKPFLETAPWLIVAFRKSYELEGAGRSKNYYVQESVGIACGILITAIHQAGLVTLTHTPSPMNFLSEILERPQNEKPFLLLPVGFPAKNAMVPDLKRKALEQIILFV
jgi:iodotyrosine deiodinase